ncbi:MULTISPECIES: hypothetical protein [Brevundimonas]|uniref:hypothetical protein n=1 Tax=Brevundimonas sp. TaxID=1871086 RepID=UPI0028ACDAB6|nr:hypothetical protein [Brevundimonas diminuta]
MWDDAKAWRNADRIDTWRARTYFLRSVLPEASTVIDNNSPLVELKRKGVGYRQFAT